MKRTLKFVPVAFLLFLISCNGKDNLTHDPGDRENHEIVEMENTFVDSVLSDSVLSMAQIRNDAELVKMRNSITEVEQSLEQNPNDDSLKEKLSRLNESLVFFETLTDFTMEILVKTNKVELDDTGAIIVEN